MSLRRLVQACVISVVAFAPSFAFAASIYIDPASGSYGPGDTFIAAVRLNTEGQCINAGKVELAYPIGVLRVVDISEGDSIFSLWVQAPIDDTHSGTIDFSGGVPGGYCGRIQGDPANSNVLAKIIFIVERSHATSASISLSPVSEMYLNDGMGTKASLTEKGATFALLPKATLTTNTWLQELKSDTTPPEPFTISVQSVPNVFGGDYFAVFSTTDKQSGIDHYEIFENGFWQNVTSPHRLADQSLKDPIEIRAVDKAGNMRLAVYVATTTLPKASRIADFSMLFLPLVILAVLIALRWFILERRKHNDIAPPSQT